jgi:hypothetical protein
MVPPSISNRPIVWKAGIEFKIRDPATKRSMEAVMRVIPSRIMWGTPSKPLPAFRPFLIKDNGILGLIL